MRDSPWKKCSGAAKIIKKNTIKFRSIKGANKVLTYYDNLYIMEK